MKHTPEQIVGKLREAGTLLAQGLAVPRHFLVDGDVVPRWLRGEFTRFAF
jgi:hypothetical protein